MDPVLNHSATCFNLPPAWMGAAPLPHTITEMDTLCGMQRGIARAKMTEESGWPVRRMEGRHSRGKHRPTRLRQVSAVVVDCARLPRGSQAGEQIFLFFTGRPRKKCIVTCICLLRRTRAEGFKAGCCSAGS